MQKAAPGIILVLRSWCGLGFHRSVYGYCIRNGTVAAPPILVVPSPVVVVPAPGGGCPVVAPPATTLVPMAAACRTKWPQLAPNVTLFSYTSLDNQPL